MKASFIAAIGALWLVGCGGSNSFVTVTLTTSGVTTSNSTVRFGYDLLFVNKDTVPHSIGSRTCTDLAVLNLAPGGTATVNVGNVADVGKGCDLYDPQNPNYGASFVRVSGAG